MPRPLRFGVALRNAPDGDPAAQAQRAEALGYDVVVASDHLGPGLSPMLALAAAAQATESIRLSTLVINADLRTPTQLAWEAVTLDHLSGGRFELGVGAGHTPHEYLAVGALLQPAAARKARLMELVELLRRLLDGETVDHEGEFFHLSGATVGPSLQPRLPILVGGNGAALLEHAGRHADIVGLQGLGRTLPDGHRHEVKWTTAHLDAQLEQIQRGAGDRMDHQIELNALVQMVEITDNRRTTLQGICAETDGLQLADAEVVPYLLVGTVDEIAQQIENARQRWGITYFVIRDAEAFHPVMAALAQRR